MTHTAALWISIIGIIAVLALLLGLVLGVPLLTGQQTPGADLPLGARVSLPDLEADFLNTELPALDDSLGSTEGDLNEL